MLVVVVVEVGSFLARGSVMMADVSNKQVFLRAGRAQEKVACYKLSMTLK